MRRALPLRLPLILGVVLAIGCGIPKEQWELKLRENADLQTKVSDLERQKTMLDEVYGQIADSFLTLKANLQAALEEPANDVPLKDNMLAAEQCMAVIRAAVALNAERAARKPKTS